MENAALRVQLVAFQRKRKRPTLTSFDRLFWVGLSLLWTGWRAPPVYVRADTVVRWQRERFRRFWARRSRVNQRHRGRPAIAVEIRRLIERSEATAERGGRAKRMVRVTGKGVREGSAFFQAVTRATRGLVWEVK